MRKSEVAAERSISKARRKAHRNGTQIDEKSLELHHYILVLTSLSTEKMEAGKVLEFYRGRWQVELAFKRLKTLLQMGHVPKTSDASAKAWMQAKLLFSLILERVVLEGRFFSPWGYRC